MKSIDLIVLVVYLIGLLAMGAIFAKMKNTQEMFNAGGQSPWWLSGLSSFMTTFSAGTFVIWGGIAYRYGLVAVSILTVLGFAAILCGWLLAGKWKNLGYESAAEFLHDRFGKSIVHFYTILQGIVGIFTLGGAVYALAVIITALIPLPADHFLADPDTGHMSVTYASLLICVLVIIITTGGGLWAVLMTDALQFIILFIGVLAVIPLILTHTGGMESFIEKAPPGFFSLVSDEFTWLFLVGWSLVYFFKFGGEWGYIQRFACVPTAKDARKSSYLFGILYIVSPVIWMLPPMVFRTINPNVNYEQAYILACQMVLPAGMLGLMVAAMCSATASTVTTQLNVYAGAFTSEFYQRMFRPNADQKELVLAGRIITVLLGGIAIAGALLIPYMGTYTGYVLASVAILTGPMVIPTIWGLFSKKIGLRTAWFVTTVSAAIGIIMKMGFQSGGWFENLVGFEAFAAYLQSHERVTEIVIGLVAPVLMLLIAELLIKQNDKGWDVVMAKKASHEDSIAAIPSTLPARLCGWSTVIVGIIISVLTLFSGDDMLIMAIFSVILLVVGGTIVMASSKKDSTAAGVF